MPPPLHAPPPDLKENKTSPYIYREMCEMKTCVVFTPTLSVTLSLCADVYRRDNLPFLCVLNNVHARCAGVTQLTSAYKYHHVHKSSQVPKETFMMKCSSAWLALIEPEEMDQTEELYIRWQRITCSL